MNAKDRIKIERKARKVDWRFVLTSLQWAKQNYQSNGSKYCNEEEYRKKTYLPNLKKYDKEMKRISILVKAIVKEEKEKKE